MTKHTTQIEIRTASEIIREVDGGQSIDQVWDHLECLVRNLQADIKSHRNGKAPETDLRMVWVARIASYMNCIIEMEKGA